MALPCDLPLSIKDGAGEGRSIAKEVLGTTEGNISLNYLCKAAGKGSNCKISDFLCYVKPSISGCSATNNAPTGIDLEWTVEDVPDPASWRIIIRAYEDDTLIYEGISFIDPPFPVSLPTGTWGFEEGHTYTFRLDMYPGIVIETVPPITCITEGVTYVTPTTSTTTTAPTTTTTTTTLIAPGIPRNWQFGTVNLTIGMQVAWQAPKSGGTVEQYRLTLQESEDGPSGPFSNKFTTTLPPSVVNTGYTISPSYLVSGRWYRCQVRAENSVGVSSYLVSDVIQL